jgi:hypothetical protein
MIAMAPIMAESAEVINFISERRAQLGGTLGSQGHGARGRRLQAGWSYVIR